MRREREGASSSLSGAGNVGCDGTEIRKDSLTDGPDALTSICRRTGISACDTAKLYLWSRSR